MTQATTSIETPRRGWGRRLVGKTTRPLRQAAWDWMTILRYGRPRLVLVYGEGYGDHLLCTAVLRELRRRGHRRLWMMSNHRGLFRHNRDVDAVVPYSWRYPDFVQRWGGRSCMPVYGDINTVEDRSTPPDRHLITKMCQHFDMHGPIDLRPYMCLDPHEKMRGRVAPRQIAIQSSILAAALPIRNKEWIPQRFNDVVKKLGGRFTFVQVGAASDPPVAGAIDLRGKTSVRETAAILSQSLVFVGLVGFLMHLARAVDCRAVIVYGGREAPALSGYSCNANLYTAMPCSPCWYWSRCAFDRRCMSAIEAGQVAEAARQQVEKFGQPLELDQDDPSAPGPLIKHVHG